MGRTPQKQPLRLHPVQLKVSYPEWDSLETVRLARDLPHRSTILRFMSLDEVVKEASRLRRQFRKRLARKEEPTGTP